MKRTAAQRRKKSAKRRQYKKKRTIKNRKQVGGASELINDMSTLNNFITSFRDGVPINFLIIKKSGEHIFFNIIMLDKLDTTNKEAVAKYVRDSTWRVEGLGYDENPEETHINTRPFDPTHYYGAKKNENLETVLPHKEYK